MTAAIASSFLVPMLEAVRVQTGEIDLRQIVYLLALFVAAPARAID